MWTKTNNSILTNVILENIKYTLKDGGLKSVIENFVKVGEF